MENIKFYDSLNVFTFELRTDEMKIGFIHNKIISLKDILNITKNCDTEGILKLNEEINLEITYITKQLISFNILGKKGFKIFRTPIKIMLLDKEMEIVCPEQLGYFLNRNFTNPKIFCHCGDISDVSLLEINTHLTHGFKIIDYEEIKPLDENQMELLIKNYEKKDYLNTIFESPRDFEKNFNYYFKLGDNTRELNGLFYIFDDKRKTRFMLSYEFENYDNFGKKLNYFGASGKGKSITLIGALKYAVRHKEIGTLYINCKALKTLLEDQNFILVKKILLDEILFLFYDNYNIYKACFHLINSFNFLSAKSFWEIINSLLNECSKIDKKFIIGFDQYNDSIDPENYLNELEKVYLEKNTRFKFIVISSMNEKDIRKQKLNLLFEKIKAKNVWELKNLCIDFNTNFHTDELNVFNKLGRTFKVYNEIQLLEGKNELNNYLKEKKKKYLYKLVSFYKGGKSKDYYNPNFSEEDILNSFDNIYERFLSFNINYKYSMPEIMKVIQNIPFKLFNVTENNKIYNVEPGFPLIKEILDDIYRYIVVNKNFYSFKYLSDNKGSAFSSLFEYKVRYNFYPQIKGSIYYFKEFVIHENVSMDVIIPKEKDKDEPHFIKKLEPNKNYLVEQKQFGGKDLDFLIIRMSEKPEVFEIQVSTYKKTIFDSLSHTYGIMLKRLYISFQVDIKEENVYFGYIFDYSRLKTSEYSLMLKTCDKKKMKYSFYDTDNNVILDKNGTKINSIYAIVGKIKIENKDIKRDTYLDIDIENFNPINKLNGGQISTIIDILKTVKNDKKISSIQYVGSSPTIPFHDNYVSIIKNTKDGLIIFFVENYFLQSKIISNNKIIENNNLYFSNDFDVYSIIRDE